MSLEAKAESGGRMGASLLHPERSNVRGSRGRDVPAPCPKTPRAFGAAL